MARRFIEVETQVEPGIGEIRLSRPERLNALHAPMVLELIDAVEELERDPEVRVYLLSGAPRPDGRPCFCAGADVRAAPGEMFGGPDLGLRLTQSIDEGLTPSIALVDGPCSTGGAELALSCDLRLVGEAAAISDWHLKKLGTGLGGWGGSTRWVQLLGVQRAKELILTGKVMGPDEAVRDGFAIERCASGALRSRALELARAIAEMDPRGVQMVLAHLGMARDLPRDAAIRLAAQAPRWFGVRLGLQGREGDVLGSRRRSGPREE